MVTFVAHCSCLCIVGASAMAAQERRTVGDRGSPDPKVSSMVTACTRLVEHLPSMQNITGLNLV